MKARLIYVSDDKTNREVAMKIRDFLAKSNYEVEEFQIKSPFRFGQGSKNHAQLPQLSGFDLVVVGSPVRNFSPMDCVLDFLREMKNAKNQKFFLFSTCVALPGTTLKRMSNVVTTKSGIVAGAYTVRSLFDISEEKISQMLDYLARSIDNGTDQAT